MSTSTWKYNKEKHCIDGYLLPSIGNMDKEVPQKPIPVSGKVDWKDGEDVTGKFVEDAISPNASVAIPIKQEQPQEIKTENMKEAIIKKHLIKYYHHKGREINDDDILPVSRIKPMMDEYAAALLKNQSQEQPKHPHYVVSGGFRPVDEVGGKGLEIHDQFEQPKQEAIEGKEYMFTLEKLEAIKKGSYNDGWSDCLKKYDPKNKQPKQEINRIIPKEDQDYFKK